MSEKNEWSADGAINEAELNKVSGGRSFVTVNYKCGVCGNKLGVRLTTDITPPLRMVLYCENCGNTHEATLA